MLKERIEDKISYYFVGMLLIFIMTFAVVYNRYIYSDFVTHAKWAIKLDRHIFHYMSEYISYPLWHIVVKSIYRFFHFGIEVSAATATALFNCVAGWSILYAWDRLGSRPLSAKIKVIWAVCILLMGPLYAPWFNSEYYLGQGSGNVWHNPTHTAVKGLAILCFVWIVRLVNREIQHKKWEYVFLSILLFLSALAKPSFLQAMIPGLGLYFIIELFRDGFKKHIVHFLCIATTFIPSVVLLGWQFIVNFFVSTEIYESGGAGIGIGFGVFLSRWTNNLFFSLFLALAFPLFVLLIDAKCLLKDTSVRIVLCYGLCSWLEAAFLYEKGIRMKDGNWTWGYNLALLVIWTLFIIKYFDILQDENVSTKKRAISICCGIPILFFQVLFGIGFFASYLSKI